MRVVCSRLKAAQTSFFPLDLDPRSEGARAVWGGGDAPTLAKAQKQAFTIPSLLPFHFHILSKPAQPFHESQFSTAQLLKQKRKTHPQMPPTVSNARCHHLIHAKQRTRRQDRRIRMRRILPQEQRDRMLIKFQRHVPRLILHRIKLPRCKGHGRRDERLRLHQLVDARRGEVHGGIRRLAPPCCFPYKGRHEVDLRPVGYRERGLGDGRGAAGDGLSEGERGDEAGG